MFSKESSSKKSLQLIKICKMRVIELNKMLVIHAYSMTNLLNKGESQSHQIKLLLFYSLIKEIIVTSIVVEKNYRRRIVYLRRILIPCAMKIFVVVFVEILQQHLKLLKCLSFTRLKNDWELRKVKANRSVKFFVFSKLTKFFRLRVVRPWRSVTNP